MIIKQQEKNRSQIKICVNCGKEFLTNILKKDFVLAFVERRAHTRKIRKNYLTRKEFERSKKICTT